jgi:hypothetical protein
MKVRVCGVVLGLVMLAAGAEAGVFGLLGRGGGLPKPATDGFLHPKVSGEHKRRFLWDARGPRAAQWALPMKSSPRLHPYVNHW